MRVWIRSRDYKNDNYIHSPGNSETDFKNPFFGTAIRTRTTVDDFGRCGSGNDTIRHGWDDSDYDLGGTGR